MDRFFENPLQEQQLIFSFPEERGATRYEQWVSHIARTGKKAVDFIYPESNSRQLFFTEVKDFLTITREGKFHKGAYSITLAENVAQKIKDSFPDLTMWEKQILLKNRILPRKPNLIHAV